MEVIKDKSPNKINGNNFNVYPFVVGTSTGKSYNVCLQFQESLARSKGQNDFVNAINNQNVNYCDGQPSKSRSFNKKSKNSFKVIPFVVGTSTNKSHNLGMRIQQAIALMKRTSPEILLQMENIFTENVEGDALLDIDDQWASMGDSIKENS